MPEIQVENLTKSFGDQRALDRVGFAVEEGELFTLLGPSGCGKSTTLMSIAGFQQPDEGRIVVGDQTFFDAERRMSVAAERRNLGIVFQSYAVWPHMTVFENLAFPLKVRKLKRAGIRARVLEVLDLVEMREYEKRYPHQLSGGQQQRVALARALVYSPAVLLLDGVVASREGTTLLVEVGASKNRLAVAAPEGAGLSGRVTLAFRPEAVVLFSADEGSANGTNTWDADVQEVAFLGDHYEYVVNVGSLPLTVQSLRRVPGDRIKVHIPPDACSVVSAGTG